MIRHLYKNLPIVKKWKKHHSMYLVAINVGSYVYYAHFCVNPSDQCLHRWFRFVFSSYFYIFFFFSFHLILLKHIFFPPPLYLIRIFMILLQFKGLKEKTNHQNIFSISNLKNFYAQNFECYLINFSKWIKD